MHQMQRGWRKKLEIKNLKLEIIKYKASGGQEYFIQAVDKIDNTLFGFCRLRLPDTKKEKDLLNIPLLNKINLLLDKTALIRELHVYGELVSIGQEKKFNILDQEKY